MADIDNPNVLAQDCSRPLFRWFLSRIDWRRILKQLPKEPPREPLCTRCTPLNSNQGRACNCSLLATRAALGLHRVTPADPEAAVLGARFCDGGVEVNGEHALPLTLTRPIHQPRPPRFVWPAIGCALALSIGGALWARFS